MKTLIVDQSQLPRYAVSGADHLRFLQGICTADVAALAPGGWTRASVLTAKGRVVSIVELLRREADVLLLCEPGQGERTVSYLRKFALLDDVEFTPAEGPLHRIWPDPEGVWTAPPVLAPPPGPPADPAEVEVRRIEAGLPRHGVDVSEDNFPFETPLIRHIAYDKGCYLGQEPVARVRARGNASKYLRGLLVTGAGPVAAGTGVEHPARPAAGQVTSAAISPHFGSIALAYLHRDVAAPGTSVTVAGRPAQVVELPFGSAPAVALPVDSDP